MNEKLNLTTDSTETAAYRSSLVQAPTTLPTQVGRYELLSEIARGGMGAVYRAYDTTLNREVAVKVLQEKFGSIRAAVRRFADEARIASRLQHPAIPPVHDLGTLSDGRPFLAMKLIEGDTLDALLTARPDPSHERGRFVVVFESVCQAIAYAHERQVIHRDLKPANVMVGAFGEVQVMDWGLAKELGQESAKDSPATDIHSVPAPIVDPAQTTDYRSADESIADRTQAGQVMGTPAYMPPEQARGEGDKIDKQADVFALGGLLCVILTGKPPYTGGADVMQKAVKGDLQEAFRRLDCCGAEPELVARCKQCLASEKKDRPANASEVAGLIAAYRAGVEQRLRQAEQERAATAAKAIEHKKRRRVQAVLALTLALLLLGGGAFAWWQNEQSRNVCERHGRNAEAVAALLDQCEEALRAGDASKAAVALEAAEKRMSEGGAENSAARVEQRRVDLKMLRDLDEIDLFLWTPIDGVYPDTSAAAGRYQFAIEPLWSENPDEVARRVTNSAIRLRLIATLDRLLRAGQAISVEATDVRAVLQATDPDPFRDAVRDAVMRGDAAGVAELATRKDPFEQPPEFVAFLGHSPAVALDRRRELLAAAIQRRPGDLWLLMTMGGTYPSLKREGAENRIRWYQAAIAIAPRNPAAHSSLGLALKDLGDLNGSIGCFQEAIRLNPTNPWHHGNLGIALSAKGDMVEAIAECREAVRLDPKLANARNSLGYTLRKAKDVDGAIAEFKEAIRLDPKFAPAHYNLGSTLQQNGDVEGAVIECNEAIRIDPNYAYGYIGLGDALKAKNDLEGSNAAYEQAIRIDPRNAYIACRLGQVYASQKRYAAAVRLFEGAFAIDAKLADDLNTGQRYIAACSAVQASCGDGVDAPTAPGERIVLRSKALGWLRANLEFRKKQATSASAAERKTAIDRLTWLRDARLTGTRPEDQRIGWTSEEMAEWDKFWLDVRATIAEAQKPPPEPEIAPSPRSKD